MDLHGPMVTWLYYKAHKWNAAVGVANIAWKTCPAAPGTSRTQEAGPTLEAAESGFPPGIQHLGPREGVHLSPFCRELQSGVVLKPAPFRQLGLRP